MMLVAKRLAASSSALIAASALVAGCAADGPGSGAAGRFPVTAGVVHAFTGQNAFFGLNAQAACMAAARQINAAGGIVGHPLQCPVFDTKGDPADAVPVTNRMLVSTDHLVMVLGPDGNDIPSVLPLLERSRLPEMNTVGDPRFDRQDSPFFWRLTPSDSTQAPALAYATYHKGFTKVAEIFTSDLSAQTTTGPFKAAFAQLGGTIVKSLTLSPDQASYQTEVAGVLAARPQAIVGEMDSQTAATFLSELRQQHGSVIPFVVTQRATQPDWGPAVSPAIGVASLASEVTAIAPAFAERGPAFAAFQQAMAATKASPFAARNAFVAAQYDGVIAFALAMDMARSIDPSIYIKDIPAVTTPGAGVTVVRTYARAVAALRAGHRIQYVGASGVMTFNRYNTSNRPYAAWTFDPGTSSWVMGQTLPAPPVLP